MLKPVTITLADVKALHPTAELDGAVLEPHIQKAQDLDLRPVLGDVLYYDFMSKFLVTGDASYAIIVQYLYLVLDSRLTLITFQVKLCAFEGLVVHRVKPH